MFKLVSTTVTFPLIIGKGKLEREGVIRKIIRQLLLHIFNSANFLAEQDFLSWEDYDRLTIVFSSSPVVDRTMMICDIATKFLSC